MKTFSRPPAPQGQRLFGEPDRPAAHIAYIDGASRGNPGPASYAVVVKSPSGKTEFEVGKYFGRATNNVAEYYGLIAALDAAQSRGIQRLIVRSDSELMVRQMQGRYKVKSVDLKPLHERAQKMARGFAYFAIEHVPREQNAEADALGNRALDETSRSNSPRGVATPVATPDAQEPRSPKALAAPAAHASLSASSGGSPDISKVRARYSAGALHPLGVLDLDEGDIVELTIRKSPGK
jgi:ribonuclease HI